MDFEKLYQDEHKKILNFFKKFTNNNVVVAEELANDVFMRIYKHRDNYNPEKSSIRTWLFNISKRILIDYYRKAKQPMISLDVTNDEDNDTNIDYLLSTSHVKTSTPHLDMVTKEELFKAQRAIARLPKKFRRVSNLFFNHHYMLKEISEKCNMPIGTVKGDIHKARKILQKQLTR